MFNKYDLKVWTPTLDLITTWMCVVIIFPCIFQSLKESCSWKKKSLISVTFYTPLLSLLRSSGVSKEDSENRKFIVNAYKKQYSTWLYK